MLTVICLGCDFRVLPSCLHGSTERWIVQPTAMVEGQPCLRGLRGDPGVAAAPKTLFRDLKKCIDCSCRYLGLQSLFCFRMGSST